MKLVNRKVKVSDAPAVLALRNALGNMRPMPPPIVMVGVSGTVNVASTSSPILESAAPPEGAATVRMPAAL